MPQTIKPIVDTSVGGGSYNLDAGGDWSWLRQQPVSYNRAYASISNRTRGKIGGGPTYEQFLALDDPKKHTILAAPPPLTTAILQGNTNGAGGRKVGQLNLNLIDPFGSLAQATGTFLGNDEPIVGTKGAAFDPGAFLHTKGIDVFGAGDAGVPARLADYVLALPIAVMNKMNGVTSAEPTANGGLKYRFQQDPGYWKLLEAANDDDHLRAIAAKVASEYIDPARNAFLVQQLFDQFKSDRDTVLTAVSSGNARIDYAAKWTFASSLANQVTEGLVAQYGRDVALGMDLNMSATAVRTASFAANLVTAIPFVGTQIAAGVAPISPELESAWQGLSVDQRRDYFLRSGIALGITDFAVQLPLLSGLGSALAVAKGSGGLGSALYKTYDTTLRATSLMMGSGLVLATANWAAEAAWPGYAEALGNEIDRARPISKSSLAGVVNELGFWSSGSFGVIPAVQVATRVTGKTLGVAAEGLSKLHVPKPMIGERELTFFRDGYGGSAVRTELAGAGLVGVDTAIKASFLSHMLNWVERTRREPLEAALRGEQTPWADVNAMDPVQRVAWANAELARGLGDGPQAVESLIRVLAYARRRRPILPTEEGRRTWNTAASLSKNLDETLAADVGSAFGPEFIAGSRVVGRYDEAAMEAWSRAKVTELGGDGTKLGKHDLPGWERIVRSVHQYEYHYLNGELASAIEKEASDEAGKLALIASDHIFKDNAEAILEQLAKVDEGMQRQLIADTIRTKREAAAWFTRWTPKPGLAKRPDNVPTSVFIEYLEDMLPTLPTRRVNAASGASTALSPINDFQTRVDKQGTWTLAFKPVDGEGNFVSYTQARGGGALRSPWVEYPLTGGDNIDLGNRGYLASKLDSVTRGFRTRRLTEMQRGSIFRQLSSQFDVLPEQIDAFHEGILKLAHDNRVQPQTVGAIAKLPDIAFSITTKKQIDDLVERVFGPGDLRNRDGDLVTVDWPTVIAKSYRQAFRLNLTAGVTSYLKSLGPVGAASAVASDIMYVAWRFGFSPIFKGGEVGEAPIYNALRGVSPRGDPTDLALFVRGGLGNDGSLISSELSFDSGIQAMTGPRADLTPSQRMAAANSLHARHLPDDLPTSQLQASTQEAADGFVRTHGGGTIPSYAVEGDIVPEGPAIYDPAHPVGRTVPLDFTDDAGEFATGGTFDPGSLPEDRQLLHVTTSLDSVLRRGLKSRSQLVAERSSLPQHEVVGAGQRVFTMDGRNLEVLGPASRGKASNTILKYRSSANKAAKAAAKEFSDAEAALTAWGLRKGKKGAAPFADHDIQYLEYRAREAEREATAARDAVARATEWTVPVKDNSPGTPNMVVWPPERVLTKNIVQIESRATDEVLWQTGAMGLGGGHIDPGHNVSVTHSREHAEMIQSRLTLASRAARGLATAQDILDHFVQTASHVFDSGDELVDVARVRMALANDVSMGGAPIKATTWRELENELDHGLRDNADRYNLVRALDNHVQREFDLSGSPDEFSGAVGLTGSYEDMRLVQPNQIGIVQVAARIASGDNMNGMRGPSVSLKRSGPDANELQFRPEDVFVIDDRPALPPIPDDEMGLLRHLRATLAHEPQQILIGSLAEDLQKVVGENGIKPGLEGRATEILNRLENLQRNVGDDGPAYRWIDLTPRQQEEAMLKMIASGDVAVPPGLGPDNATISYHGTPGAAFDAFDPNLLYKRQSLFGPGVYLTENPKVAKGYTETQSMIGGTVQPAPHALNDDLYRQLPVEDPGYIYHASRDMYVARQYGVMPRSVRPGLGVPDVSVWTTSAAATARYAEDNGASGLIRFKHDPADARFTTEGDRIVTGEEIAPEHIEYLGEDMAWHPAIEPSGNVLRIAVRKNLKLLDLDAPLPTEAKNAIRKLAKAHPDYDWYSVLQWMKAPSHNGAQIYRQLEGTGVYGGYRNMDEAIAWQTEIRNAFQSVGYEGFTHVGGTIMGDEAHRVRIVFDPDHASVIPVSRLDEAWAKHQRRPDAADELGDIAGTPEALFEHTLPAYAEEAIKNGATGWVRKALDTFWHPTNYKQGQALNLQIRLMKDQFPALLRASGNEGVTKVFRDLGIPEGKWATWLLEDRKLLDDWLNVKHDDVAGPVALAKLLDHAGADPAERAAFDALYASDEWRTITSLWAINLQATRDEAFGTHFFSPYRSAFERSINHPVLGIYPASWTIKAAREWGKFLFDNRTFGELRLGMAPAQAIAQISRDQASAWAQTHDESLAHFYEKGPLGSTIFIFNLLMPGDWSSLPFPLSRSIREVLRGKMNPAEILAANLDFLGATRDGQLVAESLGELHSLVFGEQKPDPKRFFTGVSTRGVGSQFGGEAR